MHIHGTSHVHGPQAINPPHRAQSAENNPSLDQVQFNDELDISREAEMISQAREMPEIRTDLVERLRAEIQAGTYETEHRLNVAVDRLLDEFGI